MEHDSPVPQTRSPESPRTRLDEFLDARSVPREQALEEYLRLAKPEGERQSAFVELVRWHGERLVVEARRKAVALGFKSPTAGDEAMHEAFIRLTRSLNAPWPDGKSFLHRFQSEVWNELRHQRAKIVKLRARFPSLDEDDSQEASPDADPEQRYQASEQLHQVLMCLDRNIRTDQQRRLADAWMLSKLGYGWAEVKSEIAWPGTCESLRVSVSRFFNQLKPKILKQTGYDSRFL